MSVRKEMKLFMDIDNSTGGSFFNHLRPHEESTGHVTAIPDHQRTAGFSAEFPVEQNRFRRLADRAIFAVVPWQHNINAFCYSLFAMFILAVPASVIMNISVTTRLIISAAIAYRGAFSVPELMASEWQCFFLGAAVGVALSTLIV